MKGGVQQIAYIWLGFAWKLFIIIFQNVAIVNRIYSKETLCLSVSRMHTHACSLSLIHSLCEDNGRRW